MQDDGGGSSEVARLQKENSLLKQLVAELSLKIREGEKGAGREYGHRRLAIERNTSREKKLRYNSEVAHQKATAREEAHGRRPRLKNELIRNYTIEKLKLGWSPEQISIHIVDTYIARCMAESLY